MPNISIIFIQNILKLNNIENTLLLLKNMNAILKEENNNENLIEYYLLTKESNLQLISE